MMVNYNQPAAEQAQYIAHKYGKDFARAIFDETIFYNNEEAKHCNERLRKLLLKHNVIKRSTKIINSFRHRYRQGFYLRVTNGNNQNLIAIQVKPEELSKVAEVLNNMD